jgi:hypothetical protein
MPIVTRRPPSAHRAPHTVTDPSGAPVGRWRRALVPGAVLLSLAAAGAGSVHWLMQASRPEHLAQASRQPLAELHTLLPGQTLQVPAGAGIRAWRQGGVDLVLMRARADDEPQRISLCDQRTGAKDDPARLYPLALLGALPVAPVPLLARKNPVVLPPDAAPGLPLMWLEGSAPDDAGAQRLRIRVDAPAAPQGAASWQVAMVEPDATAKPGAALAFGYLGQAWFLWSPPAAAGTAKPASTQAAGPAAHNHAVRLRTVPLAGCDAGAVEWQLFTTQGLDERALGAASTLWVRPAQASGPDAMRLRVPTGDYRVPELKLGQLEDRELFDLAVRQGLIRLLPDGRVAMVAADALRVAGTASAASGADGTNALRRSLVKALHHSANGAFVRAQVAQANQAMDWLAVRVRHAARPLAIEPDTTLWHAQAGGELLKIEAGMPPVSARLFATPPVGWSDWIRVRASQAWVAPAPAASNAATSPARVRLSLPVRAAPPGQALPNLELLLLGQVLNVKGAEYKYDAPACTGPGCAAPGVLRHVVLRPFVGATTVDIDLQAEPRFNQLHPAATEQLRVQVRRGVLTWVEPPSGSSTRHVPAEVQVRARDGTPLYANEEPTAAAQDMGLVPLVGVGPAHGHSVAGALARLGQFGQAQALAVTTIEPGLQTALHQVLRCVGAHDGRWRAAENHCDTSARAVHADERRITSAVVMDAATGDIVATVAGTDMPAGMAAPDLLAFDAFNPATSPLRIGAWHHTGGTVHTAGSGYKVVDALALELAAQRQPSLLPLLQGVAPARLHALALDAGKSFQVESACYPTPCTDKRAHVQNFDAAPASRYVRDGRMGLVDAMRNSVNTWFAFAVEYTDRTVPGGHADARPLGANALQAERPMLAVLDRLGFGQAQPLDGGLFPAGFAWQPGDALQTMPSHLDPIHDEHGVRQQALGLRMQTTPLQMARTVAAVATGHVPNPRLLVSLNGQGADTPPVGTALNLPLDRVRTAMGEVVRAGTAAGAFSAPALKPMKPFVFGKTGSAPLASKDDKIDCKKLPMAAPAPLACQNNAWFVGYLAPGALPGEKRTLAFAVQVSHTRFTGGAQAAPVVASWIETMWAQQAADAMRTLAAAKP